MLIPYSCVWFNIQICIPVATGVGRLLSDNPLFSKKIAFGSEGWPLTEHEIVYDKSCPTLTSIANGFNQIFISESLTGRDRVSFVISFVQNMKYERPGGVLDLLAPLASLAERYGDCDTKAILLYVLLERMGIDCAIMWSYKYKHALLGINISTRGDYKKLNGKKYYFLETTYPGWSIGTLPPDFKNKSYWIIDEIDS